jgi:hypothetical protein
MGADIPRGDIAASGGNASIKPPYGSLSALTCTTKIALRRHGPALAVPAGSHVIHRSNKRGVILLCSIHESCCHKTEKP